MRHILRNNIFTTVGPRLLKMNLKKFVRPLASLFISLFSRSLLDASLILHYDALSLSLISRCPYHPVIHVFSHHLTTVHFLYLKIYNG